MHEVGVDGLAGRNPTIEFLRVDPRGLWPDVHDGWKGPIDARLAPHRGPVPTQSFGRFVDREKHRVAYCDGRRRQRTRHQLGEEVGEETQ